MRLAGAGEDVGHAHAEIGRRGVLLGDGTHGRVKAGAGAHQDERRQARGDGRGKAHAMLVARKSGGIMARAAAYSAEKKS